MLLQPQANDDFPHGNKEVAQCFDVSNVCWSPKKKMYYLMLFPYYCGWIIICFDDDHNMVGPFHVWELSWMLIGM
jgi:hypothetical protein